MTGLVHCCRACGKEMEIERRHRGHGVPCPWCLAENVVPENLDFLAADVAAARDHRKAGWLLALSIFSFFACCLPGAAFVWWYTSGLIGRARDEERTVDPMLLSTRHVAVLSSATSAIAWVLALVGWAA